jgi:hypothetical protein
MTDDTEADEIDNLDDLEAVASMRAAQRTDVKKRLMLWVARWTIGFGLIWMIISYYPSMIWLWWVGGAVALVSLVALVVGAVLVERKLARVEGQIKSG